ncbi:protein ORF1c_2 [Anguillid herpesvirus 1]|nr:protein ORF1_2 [Anguillid herpesvirus 1]UWI83719.1 protein ORF1c_2 [Anguillid herpesvirus 1]
MPPPRYVADWWIPEGEERSVVADAVFWEAMADIRFTMTVEGPGHFILAGFLNGDPNAGTFHAEGWDRLRRVGRDVVDDVMVASRVVWTHPRRTYTRAMNVVATWVAAHGYDSHNMMNPSQSPLNNGGEFPQILAYFVPEDFLDVPSEPAVRTPRQWVRQAPRGPCKPPPSGGDDGDEREAGSSDSAKSAKSVRSVGGSSVADTDSSNPKGGKGKSPKKKKTDPSTDPEYQFRGPGPFFFSRPSDWDVDSDPVNPPTAPEALAYFRALHSGDVEPDQDKM